MSARPVVRLLLAGVALCAVACGAEEKPAAPAEQPPPPAPTAAPAVPETPDSLPSGLMLALAQFVTKEGKPVPGPARLEFLYRRDGRWQTAVIEDEESNVFHKAMFYESPDGPRILTLAGTAAAVKTWEKTSSGLEPTTRWQKDFGGKWSRMRDAEVADLFGDGAATVAVATHVGVVKSWTRSTG